jgi:GH24 family phage-related lysozyme (muramidase)
MENLLYGECRARIERFEATRETLYLDNRGNWTIGVGFNLSANHIPREFLWGTTPFFNKLSSDQIDWLFTFKLKEIIRDTASLFIFGWKGLEAITPNRQYCLVDMCYNMGYYKLRGFKKMWEAIEGYYWQGAAAQIRQSKYYRDCTEIQRRLKDAGVENTFHRAKENLILMQNG